MARYFPPPREYAPGLVLTLREAGEGGGLRRRAEQRPPIDPAQRREAVLLVHGFNNHEGEAATAYVGFRRRQSERLPGFDGAALEQILGDVFWPGDAALGVADLADFVVYPVAVGTAREAGPVLAEHLRAMPNLLTVHFIGHSLGCRVVLEAIKHLAAQGGRPVVGKVCLMAAAVPVFKVEDDGDLADAMRQARPVLVLYSDDDAVLRYTFGPGQTMASGPEGFFPTALGSRRPPPTVAGLVESVDIDGAGHSHYWGHVESSASPAATARVGELFAFGAWPRTIVARDAAGTPRPASADAREVGHSREV